MDSSKIFNYFRAKEEETIKFLQKLVRTTSVTGQNSSQAMAAIVFDKLAQCGLKPELVGSKDNPSLLCRIKRGAGRRPMLNAPLDTASIGNRRLWSFDPLAGRIVGNKLYGRGSADCKAAIAIFCLLGEAIKKLELPFSGELILAFDADEHSGCFSGMKAILKKLGPIDACLIGYPGDEKIVIGARGFLRLRINIQTPSVHSGSRLKASDAIKTAFLLSSELEKWIEKSGKKNQNFPFGSKFTVVGIGGGGDFSRTAEECFLDVDIRTVPGQAKKAILDSIDTLLQEGVKTEVDQLIFQPAWLTDYKSKIVKLLKKSAFQVLGRKLPLGTSGASNTGSLFVGSSTKVIAGFGVRYGHAHAVDEWVDVKTIIPIALVYLQTILKYLV